MSLMLLDELCEYDDMTSTYKLIEELSEAPEVTVPARLLPALVYHTACGDLSIGISSARALVDEQRTNGNVGDFFRALVNAAVPLRVAGLFEEAEEMLIEALSVTQQHKIAVGTAEVLISLIHLAIERARIEDAHRWYRMVCTDKTFSMERRFQIEKTTLAVRLTLLGDQPEDAHGLLPGIGRKLGRSPMIFHRTYRRRFGSPPIWLVVGHRARDC